MRAFTDSRRADTIDECWLLEHPPVYTLGQAGRREHIIAPHDVPVVESDRGGQITYHGPGQLVVYTLLDLRRLKIGVRTLVERLEKVVITLLALHRITAVGRRDAPGVYVDEAKIAALGLRVRKGCSYHGVALNIAAELSAFDAINPCGYRGLEVTSTQALGVGAGFDELSAHMIDCLVNEFGYNSVLNTINSTR